MASDGLSDTSSTAEPVAPHRLKTQATSNNLSLSRSKGDGCTVLCARGRGAGDLVFDSRVECDPHSFEAEQRADRPPRAVIKFRLRRVKGVPCAAAGGTEPTADRRGTLAGGTGAATGGAAPWGDDNTSTGVPGPAGHVAGVQRSA